MTDSLEPEDIYQWKRLKKDPVRRKELKRFWRLRMNPNE